jgi:subtilisin family serine protease
MRAMKSDPVALDAARLGAATGKGVRVLVADSGVEASHPALRGVTIPCWSVELTSAVTPCVVAAAGGGDAAGQGTAVAWLLHQHAPEAELHSVRVLGPSLHGASGLVLTGLRWAIREGYDIVVCSFGTACRDFLGDYKRAVDAAFCRNVWLVAGSSAADFLDEEYPAHFPTVLSTDFARLEGLTLRRRRGRLVEFVARGEGLHVPWRGGGYRTVSGASFAAPHVAALAARVRQLHPAWNACQAKAALYALAEEESL